jgi:intracellular sulfur oxidation DsrE/DsrF family protein
MRRTLVVVAVASLAALSIRAGIEAQERTPPAEVVRPFKAVVHVNFSDAERQKHGLKNVSNMLKAVKTSFEIEVVCHGDGIGLLVKDQSKYAAEVERLSKEGVRFTACENTMRDRSITKDQLLPTVVTVPSGAVEVVRKQQDGYGYFKP